MFKEKFSVRVKHYYKSSYIVQYAHYRFLKIWNEITFWSTLSLWDTERWHPIIFQNYKDAENFAKTLNSYDDVVRHWMPEEEKEIAFLEKRNEYFKEEIPYKTKIIK